MKKIVWALVGLGVIVGVGVGVETLFFGHEKPLVETMTLPKVTVGQPVVRNIPIQVTALGQVKSAQEIDLMAEQSGYITVVNVQNGASVQAGEVLFEINHSTQQAALDSAAAALIQAKAHFERIQTLVKEGAASRDELDMENRNVKQAQAAFDQAKKALDETKVTAPFSGQVTQTDLAVGSYVNVGDRLIGMVSSNEKYVQYTLPTRYLTQVKQGQSVTFKDLINRQERVNSTVTYVSPEVDPTNAAFVVRATIQDHLSDVTPGLMVMVTEMLQSEHPVKALPALSIQGDPNGFYVFVIDPLTQDPQHQAKILIRRIRIGGTMGDWVEVLSGLSPTDWVVVEGQQNVHEGQRVQYEKASS